ncbi:MAG: hypothetical protein AAF939_11360 [Planctomycetota bacterium]
MSQSRTERDPDMEARKRKLMQISDRIKRAVENGDLTEGEGKQKLIELRKELFDRL